MTDLYARIQAIQTQRNCGNCGDGSGWQVWRPNGGRGFVWVVCADCNDDGRKPKPDLCEGCGETRPFCGCQR